MQLLAREVDRRSKNLLARVQATVHFSAADSPSAMKAAIEGRIQALSNVHAARTITLGRSRFAQSD
jgi:two-component sensor histidine kinase